MPSSSDFYKNIASFMDVPNILNTQNYQKLPFDWYIVITDIRGSTKAIEAGLYKDVNVVGVSSIIAAKNACGDLDIPFIFGGDGATLFIPPEKIEAVKKALAATKKKSREDFKLELRVSIIPAIEIYNRNSEIFIARMKLSRSAHIAMAKGGGIALAEDLTKKSSEFELPAETEATPNAHKGLECRWNPIKSVSGEILTVIVQSQDSALPVYSEIISKIMAVIPELSLVNIDKISAAWPPKHLFKEISMKHEKPMRYVYYVLTLLWVAVLALAITLKRKDPNSIVSKYMGELKQNTDFIKFDETFRMVIDVSIEQKNKLLAILEDYRNQELIYYGTHSSAEAMMTCFVQTNHDHVHFVDGGSGGYTLAAKQLKAQKLA